MSLFRKRYWVWAISVTVLLVVFGSLPPVRREYHKSRLQSLKKQKVDYALRGLSGIEKVWMQVTGRPVDIANLDRRIQAHEEALVRLGFLFRQTFVTESAAGADEVRGTVRAVSSGCPWQHVETQWDTNVVVTACAQGMEQWRKRAHELGWKWSSKKI